MDFSKLKKLTIDGIDLKSLAINGAQVWKSGYKNWVPFSINADGTIYNNGLGYKNGYRIRSGGAETTAARSTITGFMPVAGLDVIRVKGDGAKFKNSTADNAINVFDAGFNNLGQIVGNSDTGYGVFEASGKLAAYNAKTVVQRDGFWEWTVPPSSSGIAYIRVTCSTNSDQNSTYAELIVTINEEIE